MKTMDNDNIPEQAQAQPSAVEKATPKVVDASIRFKDQTAEAKQEVKHESVIPQEDKPQRKYESKEKAEIARLTRRKYEWEAEKKALTERLERLEKMTTPTENPTKDNFKSEEERIQYLTDQAISKHLEDLKNKSMQEQEHSAVISSWEENIRSNFKTEEELQEYAQAVETIAPLLESVSEDVGTFIQKSPVGAKIIKWFGDNPQQFERFLNDHPFRQPQVLVNLENHLSKSVVSAPSVQVQQTQATPPKPQPAPIGTIQQGAVVKVDGEQSVNSLLNQIRAQRR